VRGLRLNADEFNKLVTQIDLIEVFNSRVLSPQINSKALHFAREHNLPGIAGSDAHTISEIGNVIVELNDFNNPVEFLVALKQAKIQGKRASPFVHFNSTWAKVRKAF
jgi:predicted metal-dependent phosphoesterase TrpH